MYRNKDTTSSDVFIVCMLFIYKHHPFQIIVVEDKGFFRVHLRLSYVFTVRPP